MSAPLAAINQEAVPVTPSGHRRRLGEANPKLTHARGGQTRASASPGIAASDARRVDGKSQAWLDALHSRDPRREEAIGCLHGLLVREARFEVGRRTAGTD